MLRQSGCNAWWTRDGAGHNSHTHWKDLLIGGRVWTGAKVFLLLRDPRDTAISGYFQLTKRLGKPYDAPIGELIRDPRHGIDKIARFNLAWRNILQERDMAHLSTHEAFRENPQKELTLLYRFFMEDEPDERRIFEAVEANTFARSQASERVSVAEEEKMKARRGKVGGLVDYLTESDLAYCDDILARLYYWTAIDLGVRRLKKIDASS